MVGRIVRQLVQANEKMKGNVFKTIQSKQGQKTNMHA